MNHPINRSERPSLTRIRWGAWSLVGLGLLMMMITLFGTDGVRRSSFAYLWGFLFLVSAVLGSLFFVGLHHVTGALWSVVVRRVAEMFAAPITLLALLFIPLFLFALFGDLVGLYPWTVESTLAGDHLLQMKTGYLNVTFFLIRGLVFFGLWILYTRIFVGRSLALDGRDPSPDGTRKMRSASGHFMVVFAFSTTFAVIDWVMSLAPNWYSTIFAVYLFSGMVLTSLAMITLAVIWLRAQGYLGERVVREDHLYNLGALLFAFTCFWGYIAFSQYMLIWYGNLPEETIWFVKRMENGWQGIGLLAVALRFVLPFFLLLSRHAKMNSRALVFTSIVVLLGHLIDLYWLIMPELHEAAPLLGWQELGVPLVTVGLLLAWVASFVGRHSMLARHDPAFNASCKFHL